MRKLLLRPLSRPTEDIAFARIMRNDRVPWWVYRSSKSQPELEHQYITGEYGVLGALRRADVRSTAPSLKNPDGTPTL